METLSLVPVILGLPRVAKRAVALTVDAGLCVLTVWLAIYLRLGEFQALDGPYLVAATLSVMLALPIFVISGLYRAIFRYSGWPAMMTVSKAMVGYGIVFAAVFLAIGVQGVPRTIGIIQPILLLLAIGGTRTVARYWLGGVYRSYFDKKTHTKALIYGAGSAGRQLAAALANSNEMRVVGFLDDDRSLQGQVLNGLAVFDPESLPDLAQSLDVEDVLLAVPSVSRKRRNDILKKISTARVAIRTLPSVIDIAQGKVRTNDLRELDVDDLLGREAVDPDAALLRKNINGQTVLITGAGGSIGSELCRQVLRLGPKAILLVDQSEYALYAIHQEILTQTAAHELNQITIIPLLASVRDAARMREIFTAWRPDTVYHAAAYKHVPMVEHNSAEGIRNNVFGTLVLAQTASAHQVKNFVLISTDKAVRPTNVMGASKRLAELVLQALAVNDASPVNVTSLTYSHPPSKTVFSMVRFGNVLGSSGSVVPKFREQIRQGGPISLTHPDITRYFMTIPEAAQLVIQAGAMGIGGDVFVLDMGEPIKIIDLATRMVELSGLTIMDDQNPDGDIEIEIVGLRPGEKLFEELLLGDNPIPTSHPRIMRAKDEAIPWGDLKKCLDELDGSLSSGDFEQSRGLMQLLVKEYRPSSEVVDWLAH
jgi:FlaA1/EpsC-like NDP-sugar epimerase